MDTTDRRLLQVPQENAEENREALAREAGLSTAGPHKRIARLKQQGYIRRVSAVLERSKLGLDLQGFLMVNFRSSLLLQRSKSCHTEA